MKLWKELYNYTMPELPGIDTPLLDTFLRDTAIEFCEATWSITADLDVVTTVPGVYEYSLDSPESGMEVFGAKQVWINDAPITPETMEDLWGATTDWRKSSGKPMYYAQRDSQNIVLYPVPDLAYSLAIVGAIRPTLTATGIPDRLYQDYRKAIAAGAKGALMAQANKPWSNPQEASVQMGLFHSAITDATVMANRARSRATLQVQFRKI